METLITNPQKILVIQTAFPGDAILTLPMIQQLKKRKPSCIIDMLCIPATAEIFEASNSINSVFELDKRGKHKSVFAMLSFINEIKKNNYQTIYCPHRSFRSAFITLRLGVKETYGFENSSLKFAFSRCIAYDYSAHEVKRNLSLIGETLNNDNWRILPALKIPDEVRNKISGIVSSKNLNKNFVAIAPGSVWPTKRYPVEYFTEIIKLLLNINIKIVLIGGKSDKDLSSQIITQFNEDVLDMCGENSFVENVELLKYCRLLICNDSAPTHLGMCADIPVLAIYCSTVPAFGFYPYNKKSSFISYDELSCKPCGIHGHSVCPLSHFDCGRKLTPEVVFRQIEKMLNSNE